MKRNTCFVYYCLYHICWLSIWHTFDTDRDRARVSLLCECECKQCVKKKSGIQIDSSPILLSMWHIYFFFFFNAKVKFKRKQTFSLLIDADNAVLNVLKIIFCNQRFIFCSFDCCLTFKWRWIYTFDLNFLLQQVK